MGIDVQKVHWVFFLEKMFFPENVIPQTGHCYKIHRRRV